MKRLFLLFLFILNLTTPLTFANTSKQPKTECWPTIIPFEKEFLFIDHDHQFFKVAIENKERKPLYLLEMAINAGDFGSNDFEYSGDFECRLTKIGVQNGDNLFWEDENVTRDWQSRGRFLRQELEGKCWQYPDYGHKRCFRLRNMNLCVEVLEYSVGSKFKYKNFDRIEKLKCKVTVIPDLTALRAIAEKSQYGKPSRLHPGKKNDFCLDCEKVIRLNNEN